MNFDIQVLDARHDRASFESSTPAFTDYFRKQARQDSSKNASVCYVAVAAKGEIVGYFTLACSNVVFDDFDPEFKKMLPRYPAVPVIMLGRLAVSKTVEKQGVGGALVAEALTKSLEISASIGAVGVIVDAFDASAKRFWEHHDFVALPESPMRLIMSMGTIKKLFGPRA